MLFEDAEEVAVLMHSPGQELLLSVSFEEGGLQRVFLGASMRQEFCCFSCHSGACPHLEKFLSWINDREEEGLFEGFTFSSDEAALGAGATVHQHAPACDVRIDPNFSSDETILKRCLGTLGESLAIYPCWRLAITDCIRA